MPGSAAGDGVWRRIVRFPARIDASSWLSWACFYLTLTVSLALDPEAAQAIASGHAFGALAIVGGAVALFICAVVVLQRSMRLSMLSASFGNPRHLTTTGAFRYSRNPIYAAFLLPMASLAVISPVAALLGCALYVRVMTAMVIAREERVLEATFGSAYTAYKARVPRWFAGV